MYTTNGAMRIRTADPLNAIEVLYQLSYNPLRTFVIVPQLPAVCQVVYKILLRTGRGVEPSALKNQYSCP